MLQILEEGKAFKVSPGADILYTDELGLTSFLTSTGPVSSTAFSAPQLCSEDMLTHTTAAEGRGLCN